MGAQAPARMRIRVKAERRIGARSMMNLDSCRRNRRRVYSRKWRASSKSQGDPACMAFNLPRSTDADGIVASLRPVHTAVRSQAAFFFCDRAQDKRAAKPRGTWPAVPSSRSGGGVGTVAGLINHLVRYRSLSIRTDSRKEGAEGLSAPIEDGTSSSELP